jgi:voltage-gated potassium channel
MDVAAEYRLEEITVQRGATGARRTVGDVRGGSFIVGIRHADGSFRPQPDPDVVLSEGDVVMAIGTPRTLERLEELFQERIIIN